MDELADRVRKFLNGKLTVTIIALDLSLPEEVRATLEGEDPIEVPFSPVLALSSFDEACWGDVGLGVALLRAYRLRDGYGRCSGVYFGRSVGTALDAIRCQGAEDAVETDAQIVEVLALDGTDVYAGGEKACLSLWSVPRSAVSLLVLEELEEKASETAAIDHSPEALIARIRDLMGLDEAPTVGDLGLCKDVSGTHRPLVDVVLRSTDTVRGQPLARAVTLELEAGASSRIERLLAVSRGSGDLDFGLVDELQLVGYCPQWHGFEMVEEPAQAQAISACTPDGRFLIVDLDAMSVHHDYLGGLSECMVAALLPVVSDLAETERSFNALSRATAVGATVSLHAQLEALRDVRLLQAKQVSQRAVWAPEQARTWSNSGQLASFLMTVFESQRRKVNAAIEHCVTAVEAAHALERERANIQQERSAQWRNKGLAVVSFLAIPIAIMGLFPALASVTEGPWSFLSRFALHVVIVLAILAIIFWVAWWIQLWRISQETESSD